MRIPDKSLRRLVVKTVSGAVLGKVREFEIETEEHSITHYVVVSSLLRSRHYLVHRNQVRSITPTEMVVDDAVSRQNRRGIKKPLIIKTPPIALPGEASATEN